MWFEELLLLALLASGVFFVGVPLFKLAKYLIPVKRNPLNEAKVRLEQARLEIEAAKLDKEAEGLYNKMYYETLREETETNVQQQEKHK